MTIELLIKYFGVPGVVIFLLIFAIRWLVQQSEKQAASHQANLKELVQELNKERTGRLTLIETHMKDCDADRNKLRTELLRLARLSKGHGRSDESDDDDMPRDPPTRQIPHPGRA